MTTITTTATAATTAPTAPTIASDDRPRRRSWLRSPFLRHYLEMVASMFVGMAVFAAATRGVLALAGVSLSLSPAWASLEMAVDMSLGMAIWMRYRGHGWAITLEMVAAMFAAPLVLIPLVWLDLMAGDSLLMVEHMAMLPLMFLVMLRHRHQPHGHG